ncbi:hypothetical protein AB4084_29205, partial [Lysobacter sp. 2RAB21]
DLGKTVATVGAFQGSPIQPLTSAAGGLVSGVGNGVKTVGGKLGGVLEGPQGQQLTGALSQVLTPIAGLGQTNGGGTGGSGGGNLVANVSRGAGGVVGGVASAGNALGAAIGGAPVPGGATNLVGGAVQGVSGNLGTVGAGIT